MRPVRDELEQLQFSAQTPQVLYLNCDRVDTLFVARLGAIKEFENQVGLEAEGKLGVKLRFPGAEVGGGVAGGGSRGSSVTYTLAKPIAQALVLETQLANEGTIAPVETAQRGDYVSATGMACFLRPGEDPPGRSREQLHRPWCLGEQDARLVALEAERSLQEYDSKGREYWLLVLQHENGEIVAASVIDASWFDINTKSSYIRQHLPTVAFGLLERRIEGIPLLSAIIVMVRPE